MHRISQELAIVTEYGSWNPKPPATQEDIERLQAESVITIRATPEGARLEAAGLLPRLLEVFAEHYASSVPSKIPFFEELQLVARDLELEIPNAKPVPAVPVESKEEIYRKIEAANNAKKDEIDLSKRKERARDFADAVNRQIHVDGVRSVKANGGRHYIGRKSYSCDEFNALWKEAEGFGFWGDSNVYAEDRNVYLR
jgi:hypothetical protein